VARPRGGGLERSTPPRTFAFTHGALYTPFINPDRSGLVFMTNTFLKDMETQLLAEEKRLRGELEEFAKQNPKNSTDYDTKFVNLGDKEDENAEEVDQFSTNLTLERTIEASLRDVEKAIERIKKGTYGVCKYCNKQIDEKRLRARPASSSCIECKKSFTQEF